MCVKKIVLFTLFLFANVTIFAHTLYLDENNSLDDFYVHFYQDKSNRLNIGDIKKIKDFKKIPNAFSLGYEKGNIWLKFSLKNITGKKISKIVYFSEDFYDTFDFYILNSKNKVVKFVPNGLKTPLEKRSIHSVLPACRITLRPHESKTVYVKLNSIYGKIGALKISNYDKFISDIEYQNYFYFIFFGVFLTVALYNLFLYIYLQDNIYLIYVAYISAFFILILLYSGFIMYFVSSVNFDKFQIAYPSTFFILSIFTQRVLNVKKYLPIFYTLINYTNILLIISLVWISMDVKTGFFVANAVSTVVLFLLFVVGVLSVKQNSITAKLYMLAIDCFIIGMIVFSLMVFGYLQYNFVTRNIPIVGSILEMIFLSLVLASKIYSLKNETIATNEKLLKLQTNQNKLLALKVESQTKDIKLLLSELNHRVKNNFQSILSFLYLQKQSFKEKEASEAFNVATKRVEAISYIHELLHNESKNPQSFKDYIESFINLLFDDKKSIKTDIDIKQIKVSTDDILMIGMILNELITNSYKHAFFDTKSPSIIIKIYEENGFNIIYYKDNGKGTNEKLMRDKNRSGYKIIQAFVGKLKNSSVTFYNDSGFVCLIKFKGESYAQG